MTIEHGPKPGPTDYLLAGVAKLCAIRRESPGATLTSSEQQANTRNIGFLQLAAEIRETRGEEALGIGEVLIEELGNAVKRRVGRKKGGATTTTEASQMEDSTL